MSPESAQTVNLVIVTIAVVGQTILLVGVALSIVKLRKSFDQFSVDIRRVIGTTARSVETLAIAAAQISQTVQNRVQQVDHMTAELLARTRAHSLEIDRLIGDLLHTVEYANREIDQIARRVFRQCHAVNAGVRATLGLLFSDSKTDGRSRRIAQQKK